MPVPHAMPISILQLSVTQFGVSLAGVTAVSAGAWWYFRRVRQERPPVGSFNRRDVGILLVFIVALPFLYAALPRWALTAFLVVTFASALSTGYRPVLGRLPLWLGIGLLIGANIWTSRTLLGTVAGWQLWWAELSVMVVLAAIAVANLYVQGGMKLRDVAWFALALACYDVFFTMVFPLTNKLVQEFLGFALDPSFGMRFGLANYAVGIGDLLIFAMFTTAAVKAYGRRAGWLALGLVVAFGCVVPSFAPVLINFVDARTDVLVPSQTFFGPAALACYLWLRRRHGPERTMGQYRADLARGGADTGAAAQPAPASEPASEPASA